MREHRECAHRKDGICQCETNPWCPFKCPWVDPDVPQYMNFYFPCQDWEPEPVQCRKCAHCKPNNNLLRVYDWYCQKFKKGMMIRDIGDHFTCEYFKEKKVKE